MAPLQRNIMILLTILSSTLLCSYAQDQVVTYGIEIQAEIITNFVEGETNGTISIETSGNPPFTYLLYNKPPWEDGVLILKEEEIQDNIFTLKELNQQNYFIMVKDADDVIGAQKLAFY